MCTELAHCKYAKYTRLQIAGPTKGPVQLPYIPVAQALAQCNKFEVKLFVRNVSELVQPHQYA